MKIKRTKLQGINIIDAEVDSSTVSQKDAATLESYLDSEIVSASKSLGLQVKRSKPPVCYADCIAHIIVEGSVTRMKGYFHEQYLVFVHTKKENDT